MNTPEDVRSALAPMLQGIAAESTAPCRCDELRALPLKLCGHRHGCPVSDYVDLELAKCGIV